MNSSDYKTFYDKVGRRNGWDFSQVKCVTEDAPWDLYREVTNVCKKSDILLDIGTGGGEAILSIAESAWLLIGIDRSAGMIETATRNVAKSGKSNVRFFKMDAEHLEFPHRFFDIVTCRHSEFSATEIAKVIVNGGTFLTQQVSENDKINIKEAFGRGQAWGTTPGTLKQTYLDALSRAGFSDIQSLEYNVNEYYQTAEDLIFLLKHTPIIPGFGQTEADFHILQQFIKENQTEKGIRTNSHRFLIRAKL
ncbi:methyltransferase domain-containing protein [Paenibacillus campinasensis]|uniref:Methyltransferase domain-containing protein n=1 Tax=Paenibacillus campinasensis TaxID=66347 RepID=A0ABW9TBJ4_9BACL|nr:class I SAM-dependent methyltransferase [Paenibacillus campinasensis]MUG68986.1 methyltransferase domain-containing protein [Paenibacillus campinasensis]